MKNSLYDVLVSYKMQSRFCNLVVISVSISTTYFGLYSLAVINLPSSAKWKFH